MSGSSDRRFCEPGTLAFWVGRRHFCASAAFGICVARCAQRQRYWGAEVAVSTRSQSRRSG
eukprot:15144867-Alexandrium_andersonii.AAC.1